MSNWKNESVSVPGNEKFFQIQVSKTLRELFGPAKIGN